MSEGALETSGLICLSEETRDVSATYVGDGEEPVTRKHSCTKILGFKRLFSLP